MHVHCFRLEDELLVAGGMNGQPAEVKGKLTHIPGLDAPQRAGAWIAGSQR